MLISRVEQKSPAGKLSFPEMMADGSSGVYPRLFLILFLCWDYSSAKQLAQLLAFI